MIDIHGVEFQGSPVKELDNVVIFKSGTKRAYVVHKAQLDNNFKPIRSLNDKFLAKYSFNLEESMQVKIDPNFHHRRKKKVSA